MSQTGGAHANVQGWYAWFLQNIVLPNASVWSFVVAVGETLVGIALILGIFTGIAAFFGSFMNMSYLLAGSVSTNPNLLRSPSSDPGLEDGRLVGAGSLGAHVLGYTLETGSDLRKNRWRRSATLAPASPGVGGFRLALCGLEASKPC